MSKAIARHLGVDVSAEGRMARNRKGIAIIIHGTPLSGVHSPEGQPPLRFMVKLARVIFEAIKESCL